MISRVRSWWAAIDPADVRERITDVNDGIIAVAGMGLGLAGAHVNASTTYAVVTLSASVGALSVCGMQLGEAFADREAVEAVAAEERRLLELTPDEELAELAEAFVVKGVSPETARAVAEELSAVDALSAQLEVEYGIREYISRRAAWVRGIAAGVAYLFGAMIPLLITVLVPFRWREEWSVLAALVALMVTSLVLSRRGMSNMWATAGRSIAVGVIAFGLAYFFGDLLL